MTYVKGYTFDEAKIQRLLDIGDDDKEKSGIIDDCIRKVVNFIDRDINPTCLGIPLGADRRELVITIAQGDDPTFWKETEPAYLKKLAEHVLSGPHILKKVD